MFIATIVVTVLMAALAALSGVLKFNPESTAVKGITALDVPGSWMPRLGAAEIAGALGVLIGLAVAPLGVAAAAGLVVYFACAIGAHVRANDTAGIKNPALPLVVAIATLVLRIAAL